MRSRAAATVLTTAGFRDVASMAGGIHAWEGIVAEGPPEAGMAYFTVASKPEELIGLAWILEEGSRKFYAVLSSSLEDKEAAGLLQSLASAEENHKSSLMGLYNSLAAAGPDKRSPNELFPASASGDIMEGGVPVADALTWAQNKSLAEILDLAISLEANSYDLYIKMERRMDEADSKRVFVLLSKEEKEHLTRLAALLDRKL